MNPGTSFLVFLCLVAGVAAAYWIGPFLAIPFFIVAVLVAASLKVANVWQKFVILRMGKLQSFKGSGMFLIVPVIDSLVAVIDQRIQTTAFNAEQALSNLYAILDQHAAGAPG
jgi:regulator of protease activity HflC (stomatin/prohibitin superfamily)